MRTLSFLISAACGFAATSSQQPPQFLLPDDVTPISHTADLTLDPAADSFTGSMRIEIHLKKATRLVWLNARDLDIKRASITFHGKTSKATTKLHLNEFVGLELKSAIGPGNATIDIDYSAPLSSTAKSGPYRRQTAADWYAFTVFTPIDARRAFPCFDEPRFKTGWQLSIRVKPGDKAFTNSPSISEQSQPDGGTTFRFARTQLIPSEVVAFAVGPFDVYNAGTAGQRSTPIRVLTPKGRKEDGAAAAEATNHVLPKLEEYAGIPYPWDKLDHIALPETAFGAVENPGLITYMSRSLLLPPSATASQIQGLRGLEAHELAHQWFGNLVTQSTWDDVWLSEGFATWFSSEIMDLDESPERAHLKLEARRTRIMDADDSPRTHPVRQPKLNREQMTSVYDRFPYEKGAAILLTLEGWLGSDTMRTGLRQYLKDHANANATSSDLAAALSKASGKNVGPVLDSMLDNTGVPVIEPRIDCEKHALVIEQAKPQSIPICWRTNTGESDCSVLNPSNPRLQSPDRKGGVPSHQIPLKSCPAWVIWNTGGTGYYRTHWTQLPPLKELTAAERLTLARDLKSFPTQGSQELLQALQEDKEPEVAAAAK